MSYCCDGDPDATASCVTMVVRPWSGNVYTNRRLIPPERARLREHIRVVPARRVGGEVGRDPHRPGDTVRELGCEAVRVRERHDLDVLQEKRIPRAREASGVRRARLGDRGGVRERPGLAVRAWNLDGALQRGGECHCESQRRAGEKHESEDILGRMARAVQVQCLAAAHARTPPPSTTRAGEREKQDGEAGKRAGMPGLADEGERIAGPWDVDPELAEQFAARRVAGVDEVVVVALEEVVAVLDDDDAMEHRPVKHGAFVEDDVADGIARRRAKEGQIALVEERLHAVADRRGVGRRSAELGRSEQEEREGESAKDEDQNNMTLSPALHCAATTVSDVSNAAVN